MKKLSLTSLIVIHVFCVFGKPRPEIRELKKHRYEENFIVIDKSWTEADAIKVLSLLHANGNDVYWLDFSNFAIGPEVAKALSELLKETTSLRALRFGACTFELDSMDFISDGLNDNKTVSIFEFSGSKIADIEAEKLSEVLGTNSTLKGLILRKAEISNRGVSYILNALHGSGPQKPSTIEYLCLDATTLNEEALSELATISMDDKNDGCALRRISLMGCGVEDSGINYFLEAKKYRGNCEGKPIPMIALDNNFGISKSSHIQEIFGTDPSYNFDFYFWWEDQTRAVYKSLRFKNKSFLPSFIRWKHNLSLRLRRLLSLRCN